MNTLQKQKVVFVRRAFDWCGNTGIELYTDEKEAVFAENFRLGKMEFKSFFSDTANVMYQIKPPMTEEEFTDINQEISTWQTELAKG